MKTAEGILITIEPGFCNCGCGGRTNGKSRFLQGHDARMKGELIQAGREDLEITLVTETGKHKQVTLEEALSLFSEKIRDKVLSGVAREERVRTPRAPAAKSAVVVAKVGRWPYEGKVVKDVFHYTDGNGNAKTATKFTVVN